MNKIISIIFTIIFIYFVISSIMFGRLLYILIALLLLGFKIYFIFLKKKDKMRTKYIVIAALFTMIISPLFLFVSGLVSYRPCYTYRFYKKTLLKSIEIFNDNLPDDSDVIKFDILMENQRGQTVTLSYHTKDTEKIEKYYSENCIAKCNTNDEIRYKDQSYYFTFQSYLVGNVDDYKVYYTDLNDEHESGVAINKIDDVIMIFDS